MINNNIRLIASFWIILSLVFLIPLNIGVAFADTQTQSQVQSSVCGTTNVKSSLILSIVTMCLPGILEKMHQYKQIKCEAVKCYYNTVKNGMGDPSFCSKHEAYQTCTYVVGEAFAVPPMAMLEYWRNTIAQALANPVGILWSAGTYLARPTVKTCALGGECGPYIAIPVIFLTMTDIVGVVQQFKDMFNNGFMQSNSADACEGVSDIRDEMQKIIDAK